MQDQWGLGQTMNNVIYDPETGLVNVKTRKTKTNKGHYLAFTYEGKNTLVHIFAWFYMTGKWPTLQIDHEDRNKLNNKWSNLREIPNSDNKRNGDKYETKNKTKYIGVYRCAPWYKGVQSIYYVGCVTINYKRHYTRTFKIEEEAALARDELILSLGDKFARLNILTRS